MGQLKGFIKGMPKIQLLDRLADISGPVSEVVRTQAFHDRMALERDVVDGASADAGVEAALVGGSQLA